MYSIPRPKKWENNRVKRERSKQEDNEGKTYRFM